MRKVWTMIFATMYNCMAGWVWGEGLGLALEEE